jgi:hypothetical protein
MPEDKCTASKESYLVSSCQINKSVCRNIFRHEKKHAGKNRKVAEKQAS